MGYRLSEEINNKCPKCLSYVKEPLIKKEHCEGPYSCLQNIPGKHTHIDSLCPFCGYCFQSIEKDGWI